MRVIVVLLLLALVFGPIAFAAASFQPDPNLPQNATLSPRQAVKSKALINRAKAVADGSDAGGQVQASEAELNALIATGARVIRPLLGRSEIDETGLRIRVAAQIPGMPQLGWVNFDAKAAPSGDGLQVTSIRLGRMNLPPGMTVAALSTALDLATPEDLGTLLLSSITALETQPGVAILTLDAGGEGPDSLFSRAVSQVREATGRPSSDAVKLHYDAMQRASEARLLPAGGSAGPWIAFAVQSVADAGHESQAGLQEDLRAALIALAAHCGDRRAIETVVGSLGGGPSRCASTRLGGRTDLRKHFTLSAGFQAIGGSAISFGLGEVKELVDAGSTGGSGYSFDDIAADRAGIAYAETFEVATPEDIAATAARIDGEGSVMPSVEGLPSRLSNRAFAARFGEVDSPAYREMILKIDRRIDALPLHQP